MGIVPKGGMSMDNFQTFKTIDGYDIAAVHTESDGKGVILWLHGITVNKDEYLDFFKDGADYLAKRGFDSLRIDFRGHGESSGTSLDFSIVGQMFDVESALEYLFRSYSQRMTQLHIVGCSFGAPPAIYTAANYPDLVKSIILISPVVSYKRTFLNPETEWGESIFNKETISDSARTKKLYIEEDFPISVHLIEEMKIIRPDLTLRELQQDIVIIHGDVDSMVPYDAAKDISKQTTKIKFISITGMDHGFMDESDELGTSEKSLNNKKHIYEIISTECL